MPSADSERVSRALHSLDPGCPRPEWVRIVTAHKAAGGTLDEVIAWSAQAANYAGEQDVRAVWRSISVEGGIGAGTLFHLARAAGYREPRPMSAVVQPIRAQQGPTVAQVAQSALDAALAMWQAGVAPTPDHPYIARKRLLLDGLRVYRGPARIKGIALEGALMMPGFADDGHLVTLQFITVPDATKLHCPGLKVEGFYRIGGQIAGEVYLGEGLGAAHSCHQATGRPAVASFGAGNTLRAAAWIVAQGGRPIIVADKGKEAQAAEIARELDCAWVEMPPDAPANYDINDLHCAGDLASVARFLAAGIRRHVRKYSLLSAADLLALPPIRWRIKGLLPMTGVGIVGGQSTAGKTFVALDMALRLAAGLDFFGHRACACPVVFLALEGAGGFAGRLRAWQQTHGDLPRNVHFVVRQAFSLLDAHDRAELLRSLQDIGFAGGVVMIDTLGQSAIGMEENSSEGMGQAIAGLQELQEAVGGLILATHHLGKDASRGLRGHSSLFAACDVVMEVARDGDARTWKIAKNKDGRDSETFGFELADVQIGEDIDGDAVTSCVVRQVDAPEVDGRGRKGLGDAQSVCLDAIGEMLVESGRLGKSDAPPTRPCIELEQAVLAASSRLTCEPRRRASRARQIIQALAGRSELVVKDGWVWIP